MDNITTFNLNRIIVKLSAYDLLFCSWRANKIICCERQSLDHFSASCKPNRYTDRAYNI